MVEALRDALLEREELIGDEILEVIRSSHPATRRDRGHPAGRGHPHLVGQHRGAGLIAGSGR